MKVTGGVRQQVQLKSCAPRQMLLEKGRGTALTQQQIMLEELVAPVKEGAHAGTIRVMLDGVIICEYDVVTAEAVEKMNLRSALGLIWAELTRMR